MPSELFSVMQMVLISMSNSLFEERLLFKPTRRPLMERLPLRQQIRLAEPRRAIDSDLHNF